jgi:hypothetical protein
VYTLAYEERGWGEVRVYWIQLQTAIVCRIGQLFGLHLPSYPTQLYFRISSPTSQEQVWTAFNTLDAFPYADSGTKQRSRRKPQPETRCCCSCCPARCCYDTLNGNSSDCCSKSHRAASGSAYPFFTLL